MACFFQVCAINAVIIILLGISMPSRLLQRALSYCFLIWSSLVILSKMIYQLRFVQADLFQHNCTDQVSINVLIYRGKILWIRLDLGPTEKRKKNGFETFVIPRQPGIVKSFKLQSRNVGTICLSWMKIVNQLHSPTPRTVLGFSSEKLWFFTSILFRGMEWESLV